MNREELEAKIKESKRFISMHLTNEEISRVQAEREAERLADLEAQLASLSKVWNPEIGEMYWFVFGHGKVDFKKWQNTYLDNQYYKFGNCYRTEAEATYVRDNQLTLTRLRRFADEHNPAEFDRFACLSYYHSPCWWNNKVIIGHNTDPCDFTNTILPTFATKELLDQATKEIGSLAIAKLFFTYDEWQRIEKEFDISGLE